MFKFNFITSDYYVVIASLQKQNKTLKLYKSTFFFFRVEICNLNPDSLDPEECPEGCTKKWEMSVFEGEWVRGKFYTQL